MIRGLFKRLFVGRVGIQPLWKFLHQISLYGMNIGGGGEVRDSGERGVLDRVARTWAGKPVVVFDVGANQGDYAEEVVARLGQDTVCHCFEPSRKTFEILSARFSKHGNVRLHPFGFGEIRVRIPLYTSSGDSGLASVYPRRLDHFGLAVRPTEDIQLEVLDDFCESQKLNHVHLLKMDVEGHELSVLKGASRLLASGGIDYIQFEFGGCNLDSRTFFQDFYYLLDPKYRLYRVLRNGLAPITRYRETDEVFLTTNFLAVSRAL